MSFGSSVGDCILLAQLAWNTYQGAKKACGEHDELTREVSSLYKVLNRLQKEISNPLSLVHKASDDKRQELQEHAAGCEGILRTMDNVLTKFNNLTGEQRRGKKLWQKIKFGNGQMKDLADIRIKLSAHTSAIMMSLNLCSLDSLGRVEVTLGRVEARSTSHGEQLRGIRKALHWVTANMAAASGDGSVWTSYTNDDQTFWRGLRRELVKEGYRSSTLQKHKGLIKDYVEELGSRGVFDEIHDFHGDGVPMSQNLSGILEFTENGHDGINLEKPVYEFVNDGQEGKAQVSLNFQVSGTEDGLVLDKVMVGQSLSMSNKLRDIADIVHPASEVSGDHNRAGQHNNASERLHTATGQDDNELSDSSSITSDDGQLSLMSKDSSDNFKLEFSDVGDPLTSADTRSSTDPGECTRMFERSTYNEDNSTDITNPPNPLDTKESTTVAGNVTNNKPCQSPESAECLISKVSGLSTEWRQLVPLSKLSAENEQFDSSSSEIQQEAGSSLVIKSTLPFAVQIEEVLDEAFGGPPFRDTISCEHTGESSTDMGKEAMPEEPGESDGPVNDTESQGDISIEDEKDIVRADPPPPVSMEEVVDEEYFCDAHPNVSTGDAIFDDVLVSKVTETTGASAVVQHPSLKEEKPKQVRFADEESIPPQETSAAKKVPEDLRFIFYYEFRDFEEYQELQESYQALFDENEAESQPQKAQSDQPESTSTFITHSPYTPPATMFDLQYYHIPASYFHTFWHPQRNPIYLHGNVFDGISLTNWIYNWTAYTFKDDSYQMNTVRRFGKTVIKLGSALSDIEHAKLPIKKKIPRDIYDEGFALWANLEDTINDIMSLAEDCLAASKRAGRLEIEFVRRFCHEMIAGGRFHRAIDTFQRQTEAWCKKARLHPDLALAWELFLEV